MKTIIALDCTMLLVSDCDHLFLSGYNWSNNSHGYYSCTSGGTWNGYKVNGKRLHWFIAQLMGLEIPEGFEIDHINRNKLDNQRLNLRIASRRLQTQNTDSYKNNDSSFIGVYFNKNSKSNPWVARISINNKREHIGSFKTPEESSEAYQAAKKLRDDLEIKKCLEIQEKIKR